MPRSNNLWIESIKSDPRLQNTHEKGESANLPTSTISSRDVSPHSHCPSLAPPSWRTKVSSLCHFPLGDFTEGVRAADPGSLSGVAAADCFGVTGSLSKSLLIRDTCVKRGDLDIDPISVPGLNRGVFSIVRMLCRAVGLRFEPPGTPKS